MSYSFLPEAETEYLDAIRFYEKQQVGLGADLIIEFERIIDRVAERPRAGRLVHPENIRRVSLERFPYAVFYRVLDDNSLQITAFAHHRRRPGYWLGRIKP